MGIERIHTLVVGGGQAGIAMSEHLRRQGLPHLVIERHRIAERWRSERWDSLVANGPAWHDRFPNMTFGDLAPEAFAPKDRIVAYFEAYARQIEAPIRCGVEATLAFPTGEGFHVETTQGAIAARNLVVATGPFQKPLIPAVVPPEAGVMQIHSTAYRNPGQMPAGAVMVVGAGSSGAQIADELCRAGRRVYLSVGPHERPPIRYRGRDFCWWLGELGLWDVRARGPGMDHVTIAVSGANGGQTVDFRRFAAQGVVLLGRAGPFADGVLQIAPDLARNIAAGDRSYLDLLDAADAYVEARGLDLPAEPEARAFLPDPECLTRPLAQIDLKAESIASIVWATGFTSDYGWLKAGRFDNRGVPVHDRGVTEVPGLYVLGLPWLTRRASPFIWGVWHDARLLADHIARRPASAGRGRTAQEPA